MRRNRSRRMSFESLEPRVVLNGSPGLLGEYFDTINLTELATTRIDPVVDFTEAAWGDAPAGTAVTPDDNYSERWTGYVKIDQPGDWTFTTNSNDGVRLWIDGQQVINHWNQHVATQDSATLTLDAGWHSIQLEHFQQDGTVTIQLSFAGPGRAKTIIPSTHLATDVGMPLANAGPDALVVLPDNSVTLNGSGTDSDGTITGYLWEKVSGPEATLAGTGTPTLQATDLQQGSYVFGLTVTDNDGNTASDTANVTVAPESSGSGLVSGELKTWHKVTVTWDGPNAGETDAVNPFLDYRLQVTFTGPSGRTYEVPGYWAADGDAANTSAASGNKWRAHLAPDEAGDWAYSVSFRTGNDIAVADSPTAGTSAGYFDGDSGTFSVAPTDKTGRDFRGKGMLQYVGGHYLQFAETGEYFLKQGADAPENFLAYADFDGPFKSDGQKDELVKTWSAHVGDWNAGDPTWQGDKGKGMIGAVNYLAGEGLNAFSFIPMNIGGDDRNVFPYLDYNERYRMDVSRLAQWEIVFEHADTQGMFMHFKTQETENELLLDGGNLGTQRILYYRELIARFGHHLALNWNLGEEINNATTAQKQAWAGYFWTHDPYQHHIVIHNGANHYDLLGGASELTGFSLQTSNVDFSAVHSRVKDYLSRSDAAGKPWAVACDEPGDASHALRPDYDAGNSHEDGRKNGIWGTFMAGGWGNEWYFGYQHDHSDLTCQDFRSRDNFWDYARYALEFFNDNDVPFWEMTNNNGISSATDDYGFYKAGDTYVVYLKNGGTTNLDLSGATGQFEVQWFDPRNGGTLQAGSVAQVTAGGNVSLGQAPNSTTSDWAVLVRKIDDGPNLPPVVADQGFSIDENSPDGTVVGAVAASDPDAGDTLSYAITGGNTGGAFAIGAANGLLSVANASALDFETTPSFALTVEATDQGGLSDAATVTVDLNDLVEGVLPAPWTAGDVGTVAAAGSTDYAGGIFTIRGSGNDIWNQADEFQFVRQPLSGDGEIIAQVTGITNTNEWAKAGVMIRESLVANSKHAMMVVTPGRGVSFQWRAVTGGSSGHQTTGGVTAPVWVKIVRAGDQFTGYSSADGVNWTQRGTTTVAMAADVQIGLAVTSHNDGVINTATVENVSITTAPPPNLPPEIVDQLFAIDENRPAGTPVGTVDADDPDAGDSISFAITGGNTGGAFAIDSTTGTLSVATAAALDFEVTPSFALTVEVTDQGGLSDAATVTVDLNDLVEGVLPTPWTAGDIGAVAAAGSAEYAGGVFTVAGSGNDIWNQADEFQFVQQPLSGDGEILARVNSITYTNVWAKAGVMIRESLDANSKHAMMVVTPARGVSFQWRAGTGSLSNHQTTGGDTAPIWVRIVRLGDQFTGYTSTDGVNWTQRGTATVAMAADVHIGLAVTAHNDGAINTSVIDNVSVTTTTPQNLPPVVNDQVFQTDENSSAGAVVGIVAAGDPDPGDVVLLAIVAGNTGGAFAVNPATGVLTVANPSVLDFETTPQFVLTVEATDQGGLTDSATVTVNLNDVDETPLQQGLIGEYYDAINLTELVETRLDLVIDFLEGDWGDAPAGTAVTPDDNYSERWTGYVKIDQTGDWTFTTNSNDGVRLWIDGVLVINHWNQHVATEDQVTLTLDAGWHSIRLEHFQQDGTIAMQLSFAGPGQSKTIIPASHLSPIDPT